MGEAYGPYPALEPLTPNMHSQLPHDNPQPLHSTESASGEKQRKHAACDECRKRKLKCSGELTGCSRCVKNGIVCIYSQQKQMGRPRKRQKTDEDASSPTTEEVRYAYPSQPPTLQPQPQPHPHPRPQPQIDSQADTPIDPSLSNIDQELTDFHNVCTGALAQTIRNQREMDEFGRSVEAAASMNIFEQNGDATSLDYPYTRYPTDISLWPDFSTIDKLPLPLTTKYDAIPTSDFSYPTPSNTSVTHADSTQIYNDPDVDPSALSSLPAIPACPCLPNLYLALSTLSTLSAFPVSQHTIDTLLSAHKTAHSVIYCPVCPQKFQTGSQNLMLGCTLLNVIADQWHRVRNTNTETLKKGFGNTSRYHSHEQMNGNTTPSNQFVTVKEGIEWRKFSHQIIRAYVFGDSTIPKPPDPASVPPSTNTNANVLEENTLKFLISALLRRQRQWHRLDDPTDEFPDRPVYDHYGHNGPQLGRNHPMESGHERNHCAPRMNGQQESVALPLDGSADSNQLQSRSQSEVEKNGSDGPDQSGNTVRNGSEHSHSHAHEDKQDHLLCLMMVKHSMFIMQALDTDQ